MEFYRREEYQMGVGACTRRVSTHASGTEIGSRIHTGSRLLSRCRGISEIQQVIGEKKNEWLFLSTNIYSVISVSLWFSSPGYLPLLKEEAWQM